ncbi:MAG: peptidylprolyl isomerase [Candidatus Polarisedimenticolia bacterium]
MRRVLGAVVLVALLACASPLLAQTPATADLLVTMELEGGAAYQGQPLRIDLEFRNPGQATIELDAAAFGPDTFAIVDEKGHPARRETTQAGPSSGPLSIEGQDTVRRSVDLSAWFPKLASKANRSWTITWSHGGHTTGPRKVRIIKPHDPQRDREAIVSTALGEMTWTLLPQSAPKHVKRFVDLARQGFYDGLTIFRVIPGIQAEGGDPNGDGSGAWDRMQPGEIDPSLPISVGLVGSSRQETSMTSDTMFFITLGPADFMKGKQTFFARVTDGVEILARLQRMENHGNTGLRDSFMLIEPLTITRIEIR